jgi:hypothetical protein
MQHRLPISAAAARRSEQLPDNSCRMVAELLSLVIRAFTATGRTRLSTHAKAVIPLRARNRLHRPKRKTLPRIEAAFARIGGLPDMRT